MSCPSSIRHRDWNPQPLECESPSITTRPGLPPLDTQTYVSFNIDEKTFCIIDPPTSEHTIFRLASM